MSEQHAPRDRLSIELMITSGMALLALLVSAYTVYVQRQQLKVQAWPRLEFESAWRQTGDGSPTFDLNLTNHGVAPAEVRAMRLSVKGEDTVDWSTWLERVRDLLGRHDLAFDLDQAVTPEGVVIGVGQSFTILSTSSRSTQTLISADAATTLDVCYCSLLDDCWLLEVPPRPPAKTTFVDRCPKYPRAFIGMSEAQISKVQEGSLRSAAANAGPGTGDAGR